MAHTRAVTDYLRTGGASNEEVDDFLDFCSTFKDHGKKGRYEVYRLWARCLRHRRTHFRKHAIFDFHDNLKGYMKSISSGDIVDADRFRHCIVSRLCKVRCSSFERSFLSIS